MKKIAVFPGSFDPITNGHIDILNKALKVFDQVILLVMHNSKKKSLFSVEERVSIIQKIYAHDERIKVDSASGLTVHYAKKHDAGVLIRGLRAVSDFEYEFQLAAANKAVDHDVETVFFVSDNKTSFISSSIIIQLFENGVDIHEYVPEEVIAALKSIAKHN